MRIFLINTKYLEAVEMWWVLMPAWKRRSSRLLLCMLLSLAIFVLPMMALLETCQHDIIWIVQFLLGIIVMYISSALLTVIAKSRMQLAALTLDLKEISLRDSLTGLYNNRDFMKEQLEITIDRCQRYNEHAVILFADLDGLKIINDSYSHLAGDSAIVSTAKRIHDVLREVDVFFRFGGDEFFIITSIKSAHDCEEEIEKIRNRIITAVSSKPIHYGQEKIYLSISIGAHIINPENEIAREIKIVDKKMYAVKDAKKKLV